MLYILDHTHSEECIEEGEIVWESSVHYIIKCCGRVLEEIVSRLHTASSPHLPPVGGGRDLEFSVGLQEAMLVWCQKLLEVLEEKGKEDMRSECNRIIIIW